MKLPQLTNRWELPYLLNALRYTRQGAELGVWYGENADYLRSRYAGGTIHLIDAWQPLPDYDDEMNLDQATMDTIYAGVVTRFAGLDVNIIRATSSLAAARFQVEQLDWIYIDANHSEAAVWLDLHTWYNRVRYGGLVSGHDYLDGVKGTTRFGVKTAVDRFAQMVGAELTVTTDGEYPSWYFMK